MPIKISTPLTKQKIATLNAGDELLFCGTFYTARDEAHKKLIEMIKAKQPLPFMLSGATIYYAGPTKARPDYVSGAFGPTTSGRMDIYTKTLLQNGLCAMIGKGERSEDVKKAIIKSGSIYLGAIGGTAAIGGAAILSKKIVAFEELQSEAIYEMTVENLPLSVLIDSRGNDYYELGRKKYLLLYSSSM